MQSKIIQEDIVTIISSSLPWEKLRNKTILITGANGFLPAYIVYTLLGLNDKFHLKINVLALVRNESKANAKFGDCVNRADFQILVQDVCEEITDQLKIDYIIHAASQASPKYYGIDPVGTLNANVIGTYNLLRLAKRNEVESFLFFSSSEVYGSFPQGKISTTEDQYGSIDPLNVRSCYAEGKRLGETMCISWMHQFGVPIKIVRPFHTYGPGMDLKDGRVYADFIADIVSRRDIKMNSDGSAIRAFCYLTDATIGFLTVLLKGESGNAYNIGNNLQEISIGQLADKLINLFPERKLKVIKQEQELQGYIKSIVSRNVPNIEKANNLGWFPQVTIEEGFKRTIESHI